MANISFSKLGLKTNTNCIELPWGENGAVIEVKEYLPYQKKVELVTNVLSNSIDDKDFYNPLKVVIFMRLEIVQFYTNINFTDKMKKEGFKTYDMIYSSGLYDAIITKIGSKELQEIQEHIYKTIENIYAFKNSALGILDAIKSDYTNLNDDMTDLQEKMSDPNVLTLLKTIMEH